MLRADDLLFEPGTLTVVLGANGAGKTVWLEKLAGLRDPEGLTVYYGDEPLWKKSGRRLNPAAMLQYAYAGQSPEHALFLHTVREELRFSLRPFGIRDEKAMEPALEAVGQGRDWLDRDPFRMSGGEKRRTGLALALATPAPWLLLDEPTAGLDRDGHELLAVQLERWKREGRGVILVSHELDWALPLADQVLLLYPGGVKKMCRTEELVAHPERLAEAGMRVPEWFRWIGSLRQSTDVPLERLWNPAGAADAMLAMGERTVPDEPILEAACVPTAVSPASAAAAKGVHPLTRFDPRAVWLSYVLIAAGLFSLSDWPGLLAGGAAVTALLTVGRIPLKRWKGLILGYVTFSLMVAMFASIVSHSGWNGSFTWEADAFIGTLFPLTRTLLVMLIGLTLPVVMTPLSLRRSLEPLTPRGGKFTAVWQRLILTLTLTIRFVPVLLTEWERFGRIFLARGKETAKTPWTLFRRLKGTALPLLLSLFRLGDEAAVALESRGVRRDVIPTRASRLLWKWRDTAFAAGAAVLTGLLWLLD